MPVLRLRDLRTGDEIPFEATEIFVGRDPEAHLVVGGLGNEVVSARHLRLSHTDGQWWVEDLGSSNGTFINGQPLSPGQRMVLPHGAEMRLGESGPRFVVVEAAGRLVAKTLLETPVLDPGATAPSPSAEFQPPAPPADSDVAPHEAKIKIKLRSAQTNEEFKVARSRIVIGRGPTCDVRWLREQDTIVSREHAEIALSADNKAILRDLGSRNGTLLNGERLTEERELHIGDKIELGRGGPEIVVEVLVLPGVGAADAAEFAGQTAAKVASVRPEQRRSFGGKGRTQFVQDVIDQSSRKKSRVRSLFWAAAGLVIVGGAALAYWIAEIRPQETSANLERPNANLTEGLAAADSIRAEARENIQRIRSELAEAGRTSAPEAVVDSLRAALDSATARTELLEATLARAQEDVSQHLADIDAARREHEREAARFQSELDEAIALEAGQETVDSLRREVAAATAEATRANGQLDAIRNASLASVAQANQGAIGLVQVYYGSAVRYGTGFVLTRSGYFITNRNLVARAGPRADSLSTETDSMPLDSMAPLAPDSIFVVMADQQTRRRATAVRIANPQGSDFAVLQIAGYSGPTIIAADWDGALAIRGAPAVLIGFPVNLAFQPDEVIRTSLNAGFIEEVAPLQIRFGALSDVGSSGSPIFNADGIVVAVHGREFEHALRINQVIPLLPTDAVQELRLGSAPTPN